MTAIGSLQRLLEAFFRTHLIALRNVSPLTVRAYRDAIRLLLLFAASRANREVSNLEIEHLGREAIMEFLDHLEASRGNSIRTRNARLAAVHSFIRFVAAEEPSCADQCRQVLGIPFKRRPVSAITCLDREEVEHILASVDGSRPAGRRDAALLLFLYNTGARAQEVVQVRLPAVRLDPPAQVRLLGKGRRERLCPLWSESVAALRHMLRTREVREDADVPLFLNAAGRPLTRFGLRHIIRSCVAAASVSRPSLAKRRISPHTFRHTTALHLLQSGVDITVVRSWLGHASVTTTHEYIEIDLKMKRAALEACTPPTPATQSTSWQQPDLLRWLQSL